MFFVFLTKPISIQSLFSLCNRIAFFPLFLKNFYSRAFTTSSVIISPNLLIMQVKINPRGGMVVKRLWKTKTINQLSWFLLFYSFSIFLNMELFIIALHKSLCFLPLSIRAYLHTKIRLEICFLLYQSQNALGCWIYC